MLRRRNRLNRKFLSWINRMPEGYVSVENDRMMLRFPVRSDMANWITLRAESEHFLRPWEPQWPEDDLSANGYLRRLRSYRRQIRDGRGFTYFLFDTENDELLGGLSLTRMDPQNRNSAMLGYWMGERHAGRGIMRRAVAAILDHAFDTFELEKVEAACVPNNFRSISLLKKAGFKPNGIKTGFLEINGVMEDHLLLSLSRSQRNEISVQKINSCSETNACVV